MNQSSNHELSTLDLISSLADTPLRPLDFTLVFRVKDAPSVEALRLGARSARNLYPTTGSQINQRNWVRSRQYDDALLVLTADSTFNTSEVIEQFVDRPFDPHLEMPVQQLLIVRRADESILVTRFHHAAADGLSAFLWLRHQLRVAQGADAYQHEVSPFETLHLRTRSSPVKPSFFAFHRQSDPLWVRGKQPSRTRRWRTLHFKINDLRERCRCIGGFTYNDLLATCLLEVFILWNLQNGTRRRQNIGLWVPVNVRKKPSSGFGNGTSRIRLHARYASKSSLIEKCQSIRRQISWLRTNGEWAVPSETPLANLPFWALKPILRGYLNRPRVDMCTGVFSHVERSKAVDAEVFENVDGLDCIGPLHKRHSVAVNGSTFAGQTSLTFTYDPNLLSAADIDRLVGMYQEQIDRAWRELK